MHREIIGFQVYHKTNTEASTVLCSFVKTLGKRYSIQDGVKNTQLHLVFSPTLLSCSTAQSRLLYIVFVNLIVTMGR